MRKTFSTVSIIIILIVIGLVASFDYWYLVIRPAQEKERAIKTATENARQTAQFSLKQWLENSLRPEFLPAQLTVKKGGECPPLTVKCIQEASDYIYGALWNVSDENFYAEQSSGSPNSIDYFAASVYSYQRKELDSDIALDLTEKYFLASDSDPNLRFECLADEKDTLNRRCTASIIKEKENSQEEFSVLAYRAENGGTEVTIISYALKLLDTLRYGK